MTTAKNTMTLNDLRDNIQELGFTFGAHRAMSGSEYITVNGRKYRFADHEQPSIYQTRNYTDVYSYEKIIELAIAQAVEDAKENSYIDEEGHKNIWRNDGGGYWEVLGK